MERELKIVAPDGYEIDKEQSTFERIVFKEKEDKLPESWLEFSARLSAECAIVRDTHSQELVMTGLDRSDAEAHYALLKLHHLRDCYRQGWKPTSNDIGVSVFVDCHGVTREACTRRFLSFPNREIAAKFAVNFKDLLSTAKDLLR